jgi:hypothetical protein
MSEKEVTMNGESLKESSTEWIDQTKKNNFSHKSAKNKGKKGDRNRESRLQRKDKKGRYMYSQCSDVPRRQEVKSGSAEK